ncbi:hypothetical protein AALO_G00310650 [Alosa alosa]|uniref:Uncharacterized protein n=1 Tax=Alosa alosa TaxID=278164 RepID=A0AAV6FGB7_9TELE|nr:hypothetical protein AALO_G00310650 [Alosa alosa]
MKLWSDFPSGGRGFALYASRTFAYMSCVSMKSDRSKGDMPQFSSEPVPSGLKQQTHRPPSPVPSCVSMRSDWSKGDMPQFSSEPVPSGLK